MSIAAIVALIFFAAKQSTNLVNEIMELHRNVNKAHESRASQNVDNVARKVLPDAKPIVAPRTVSMKVSEDMFAKKRVFNVVGAKAEQGIHGNIETTTTALTTTSAVDSSQGVTTSQDDVFGINDGNADEIAYDKESENAMGDNDRETELSEHGSRTTKRVPTLAQHYDKNIAVPEKRHVVFIKCHKTGSSTAQNIFLRFGEARNLTFVLAHDNKNLSTSHWPNVISYSSSLSDSNIVPPPKGKTYDIMCCHVVYNKTSFRKYMPADSVYIGLIRDPVARLESSFRYFNMFPGVELSDFAANPLKYDTRDHSMANNRMALEFGFPSELFPNSKIYVPNRNEKIQGYLGEIMKDFDLIMLTERMDESVILLKRLLGWQIKDVLYQKLLVARKETRRFNEEDIIHLKNSYLDLDFALYKRASQEFDEKVEKAGRDFLKEVQFFKGVNTKVTFFCTNTTQEPFVSIGESSWSPQFTVTREECALFKKQEIKFIQDIRLRMYGKLNI